MMDPTVLLELEGLFATVGSACPSHMLQGKGGGKGRVKALVGEEGSAADLEPCGAAAEAPANELQSNISACYRARAAARAE